MDASDEARRRTITTSDARWRMRFAILAVIVPLALFALFRRNELRLRALADHGHAGTASVTAVERQGGAVYTHYRYEVARASYTWSVSHEQAPYEPGAPFAIVYVPEDPSCSRPGTTYTIAQLEAELNLPFQRWLLLGIFAFFAGAAGLCHRNLRRLRGGAPLRTEPLLSPEQAGRLVMLLLLGVTLASNADPHVQAIFVAAFGAAPLGLPAVVVVSLAEIVLAVPYFWVFPHLMRIVMDAARRGGSLSRTGVLAAVLRADGEHARSRAVVLGGLAYFVVLVAAWIAFTASRGI